MQKRNVVGALVAAVAALGVQVMLLVQDNVVDGYFFRAEAVVFRLPLQQMPRPKNNGRREFFARLHTMRRGQHPLWRDQRSAAQVALLVIFFEEPTRILPDECGHPGELSFRRVVAVDDALAPGAPNRDRGGGVSADVPRRRVAPRLARGRGAREAEADERSEGHDAHPINSFEFKLRRKRPTVARMPLNVSLSQQTESTGASGVSNLGEWGVQGINVLM